MIDRWTLKIIGLLIFLLASGVVCPAGTDDLFTVAEENRVDNLRRQVAAGAEIDARNRNGWTPLMVASSRGNLESAKELLAAGAEAGVRDNADLAASRWSVLAGARRSEVQELLRFAGEQ